MIKLIRDNEKAESTEVLSTKEFNNTVLDTISSTALKIKERTQTEDVITDFADIIELMNAYLISESIKSEYVFEEVHNLRSTLGTFSKKLIIKGE